VGALAKVEGESFDLEAFIGMPDGTRIVRSRARGRCADARAVGHSLGEQLLASGGREILKLLAGVAS
jgi:hydroxymethylbilane synthase